MHFSHFLIVFVLISISLQKAPKKRYTLPIKGNRVDLTPLKEKIEDLTDTQKYLRTAVGTYNKNIGRRLLGESLSSVFDFFTGEFGLSTIDYYEKPDKSDVNEEERRSFLENHKKKEDEYIYHEEMLLDERRGIEALELEDIPCIRPYPFYARHFSYYAVLNTTVYNCNGTNVTEFEYNQRVDDSYNKCHEIIETDIKCICSHNRKGETCNQWREVDCKINLLEPIRSCTYPETGLYEQGGISLFGDFKCLEYSRNDVVNFTFNMNCSFAEDHHVFSNETANDNYTILNTHEAFELYELMDMFNYWYKYEKNDETIFTIFWSLDPHPITMRPYNFDKLGSRTGVEEIYIMSNPDVFNERLNFTYQLNFSMFDDSYFTANRMYFEVGMKWLGVTRRHHHGVYVDFKDLDFEIYYDFDWGTTLAWIGGGTGIAIFVLIIAAYFITTFIRNRKFKKSMGGEKK